MFACSKFHKYIYGQQFVVEGDYKSLKNIFWSPVHKTPPRIQRFIMFLQKYNFVVEYFQWNKWFVQTRWAEQRWQTTQQSSPKVTSNPKSTVSYRRYQSAASNYNSSKTKPLKTKIIKYINEGWRKTKSDTVGQAKPYFHVKHELPVTNNVIMKGSRLVIPLSLRNEMKKVLHTGHLGIERTKSNARSALYWHGICN